MRASRWIENLLLVVGLAALDVWIWSHALPAIYENWQDREFERDVAGSTLAIGPKDRQPEPAPAPGTGVVVGRLSIPRLRLHSIVREGDGEATLTLALGHIPHTAMPGQAGNVGVAGHRDTIFRSLRSIRKGDLIVIETLGGNYTYRVDGIEIVKPDDVSVLNSGRARELTLVTCYPFQYAGSAPDRFIVRARQVTARAATSNQLHSRYGRRA